MPKLGGFPFFGKRFFRRARQLVGVCHFAHLWRAVVALAGMQGRRSTKKIKAACLQRHSRQSIGFFLHEAHWNAPQVLAETALDALKGLGWKPGDALDAVLDDTQKTQRAKQMDAVSKIFLHAERRFAHGHTIVGLALVYRGVALPFGVRLWAPQSFCQHTHTDSYDGEAIEFFKLTELAAQLLSSLPMSNVTVLFDAYYLCPRVTRACEAKKHRSIGGAKSNRNFFPDGRPHDKRKLGAYGAGVLKRDGRWVSERGKRRRLAERIGRLSKIPRVKLVFSRRARENRAVCLATNALRWGAARVLKHYLIRWTIEVFFKESKQYLGLGDYQLLRYRGIERYLCLVLIAHLLLTHLGAVAQDAQALLDATKPLDLPSTPQLQILLREKLWNETINALEKSSRDRRIGRKLKDRLLLYS